MQRNKIVLLAIASIMASLSFAYSLMHLGSVRAAAAQAATDQVIYLDQGWSKEVREGFYHISQGTTVMPYDIFLNLDRSRCRAEPASSQFRVRAH